MRIAIIGSGLNIAPFREGKIHAPLKLTFELAQELSRIGHEVTFFGIIEEEWKDKIRFKNVDFGYKPRDTINISRDLYITFEQAFMARAFESARDFDVFYSYWGHVVAPLTRLVDKPVVATHHDSTHMEDYNYLYQKIDNDNFFLIPISKYIDGLISFKNKLEVAHNGVIADEIPFVDPKEYFCWVGRFSPSKGLHTAIQLAEKMDFKLKVAGPTGQTPDFGDLKDYEQEMLDKINTSKNIEYLGTLSQKETYKLLSESKALLFPTDGTESCPMVVIEAMTAGTPVITFKKGPLPEIVKDGVSGFLCDNEDEIEKAINQIGTFDRKKCRESVIKQFSITKMAEGYADRFEQVAKLSGRK